MFRGSFAPIHRGATWIGIFRLTYRDQDGVSRPIPQGELEALTFCATFAREHGEVVLSASNGRGISVLGDGLVEWRMESAATARLRPGSGLASVDVTDGSAVDPIFRVNLQVRW
jgi:hypothetical protein